MNSLLIGIFLLVYLAIAMEHPLGVTMPRRACDRIGVDRS